MNATNTGKIATRDKLLFAALNLFSEKGYDGVSVDQIAASVGMKGPVIYRHFSGKEGLLEALGDVLDKHYSSNMAEKAKDRPEVTNLEQLKQMIKGQLAFTMHDPMIKKARRFLTIEQFRNSKFAELLTLHSVLFIERMYTGVLLGLMKRGEIIEMNPQELAFELVSPITVLIYWFDREPSKKDIIMQRLDKHIEHFVNMYRVQK